MLFRSTLLFLVIISTLCVSSSVNALTLEELASQMEKNSARLDRLEQENARLKTENEGLKAQISATKEQVDTNTVAVETVSESYGSLDYVPDWINKFHIGGYGELHYNNLDNKPGKANNGNFNEIDLHRFVLFFGWEFTERLQFYSEVEYEHNVTGGDNAGEVEIEQAYIQYNFINQPYGIIDSANIRGGVMLIPVGILNETHEPPTFYGVERNDVERDIIPATWWEGGIATTLNFNHGISLDFGVTSGLELPGSGSNAFRIRSGRQKVSEATINDLAYTTRLKYTGIPGLRIAGSVQYQSDIGQSNTPGLGSAFLYEADLIYDYNIGPGTATVKALWARWDINGSAIEAVGADQQFGWYVEPSYRFNTGVIGDIGFYGRYQKVRAFRLSSNQNFLKFHQWEGGVNWWPHNDVVVKLDYRDNINDQDGDFDYKGFDLGIGYQF